MNVTGFYAANWSSVHGCGGRRAPYRSPRRSGPSGRHGVRADVFGRLAQPPAPQLRVRHRAGGRSAVGPRQRRPRVVGIRRLGLRPQDPRAGRRRRLTVGVVAPAGDRAVVGAKSAGMPDAAAHRRETLPRRWPLRLRHRPQSRDQPKGQGRSQWAQYPQQAAAPRASAAGYGSCTRGTLSRV